MRTNGLSNAEMDVLVDYIRDVANQLGLTEWEFTLSAEPTEHEDAWASIDFVYGRRFGTISIGSDFRELVDRKQRYVVVHELLHCVFEPLIQQVKIGLRELCEVELARETVIKLIETQVEFQTDLLAVRLAYFFPMIPWEPTVDETAIEEPPLANRLSGWGYSTKSNFPIDFTIYDNPTPYTQRTETDEAAAAQADLQEGSAPAQEPSSGGSGALDEGTLSDTERC